MRQTAIATSPEAATNQHAAQAPHAETRPKRVCFLSTLHPLDDKRAYEKEAKALKAAGYEVLHIGRGFIRQGAKIEDFADAGITLIPHSSDKRSVVGRLMDLPRLFAAARKVRADVYHCNEPDSWLVGIALKYATGSKVVFDVHEHYPSIMANDWLPQRLSFFKPFASSLMKAYLYLLTPLTDLLVYAKRTVAPDFPAKAEKTVLVINTVRLGDLVARQRPTVRADDRLTLVHIGATGRYRGWPQLLESLRYVPSLNTLRFHFIGTNCDQDPLEFTRTIKQQQLEQLFSFSPQLQFGKAYDHLLSSDIGLILFQPGPLNHTYAMPHKLFDYMLAGIPVIAPDFAIEVAEIVRETQCGILVDPSNPKQIADAINLLVQNKELREQMGAAGRAAVLNRYNWDFEAKLLCAAYERMLAT
jgi:glycosyltransferase involved in cell wall biosynthesis